jgi:hypothetical protein
VKHPRLVEARLEQLRERRAALDDIIVRLERLYQNERARNWQPRSRMEQQRRFESQAQQSEAT